MSGQERSSNGAVRERFATARRAGYAAWLWPEISVEAWQSAVEAIANVAARVIAGDRQPMLASGDAKAMGVAGYTSGMGPLLGFWVESGTICTDDTLAELFQIHLSNNRQRMQRLSRAAREVTASLNKSGISPLILKGMHTAFRYFPEPATRALADIDVFIPMDSMGEAERIFRNLGYVRVMRTRSPYACDWIPRTHPGSPRTLTFVHQDDPWSIDVLGTLDRRLATGEWIKFANCLPCTEDTDLFPGIRTCVLRQPLLALYLASHISQTLLNVTVLRILELTLVIRRDTVQGQFDWNEFLRATRLIGGARFVYPALAFTNQLAPETIPGDVMAHVADDAPGNLRRVVESLTIASAQPLRRHSVSERFMWAGTAQRGLRQIASELFIDGQGRPRREIWYRLGSKLWALGRGRYTS